jgi:hypothetical protein
MLALKTNRYRYRGWGGANEILDEDWDELFAPALVTATPWEQWEGTGRNNFGTMIIERPWRQRRPPLALPPPHPWVRPARPELPPSPPSTALVDLSSGYPDLVSSSNALLDALNEDPARREESERSERWLREWKRRLIPEPVRLELKDVEPLRPFCYRCGWRQGGPDSWNGTVCKCGTRGEPLRSASGNYFYGKVARDDHKGV